MCNIKVNLNQFETLIQKDIKVVFAGKIDNYKSIIDYYGKQEDGDMLLSYGSIALSLINHIRQHDQVRLKKAFKKAVDMMEGSFQIILSYSGLPTVSYIASRNMESYLGVYYTQFILSDALQKVLPETTKVVQLDNDTIAETYKDGTCFFNSNEGIRLNNEYLNIFKSAIKEEFPSLNTAMNHKDLLNNNSTKSYPSNLLNKLSKH